MSNNQQPIQDTHHLGNSGYIAVKSFKSDMPSWLSATPFCRVMERKAISHLGIMKAVYPFEVVRLFQSGTFMLACVSGVGEVLVEGKWIQVMENEAYLLPPFIANGIRAIPSQPEWKFCWVRYNETPGDRTIVTSRSPIRGDYDAGSLSHALRGLHAEASKQDPSLTQCYLWTELVHGYVTAFAQPKDGDQRLWRLWQKVEADPSRDWSLSDMAEIACMSTENLRRISLKELGCPPMNHLTSLRVQRACHLLQTTDDKISSIAHEVGYKNPFKFSTTFRKFTGTQPSYYRKVMSSRDVGSAFPEK